MKNKTKNAPKTLSTVVAISVLSSGIMLSVVGAYRLSSSPEKKTEDRKTDSVTTEEPEE